MQTTSILKPQNPMEFNEFPWPEDEKPPALEEVDKQASMKKEKKPFTVWSWLKAGTKVKKQINYREVVRRPNQALTQGT